MKQSTKYFLWDSAVKMLFLVLILGFLFLVTIQEELHNDGLKQDAIKQVTPILLIEEGTGTCLTTYEPFNKSFHACWPVAPPNHVEKKVPKGTTPLEVFQNPGQYVDGSPAAK
jgi:hypothetical protein